MRDGSDTPGHDDLLALLRALEVELHHPGVPLDRSRLEQLLHPQFHEVGRSGRRYGRATVIDFLASHPRLPPVESHRFAVEQLGPDAALLTFDSVQHDADGRKIHPTHRASLWVRTGAGWQLRYHQGTPSAADD